MKKFSYCLFLIKFAHFFAETDEIENEELKYWLKFSYEQATKDEIVEKWKQAYSRRMKDIDNKELLAVLKEWPLFKNGTYGSEMVRT